MKSFKKKKSSFRCYINNKNPANKEVCFKPELKKNTS